MRSNFLESLVKSKVEKRFISRNVPTVIVCMLGIMAALTLCYAMGEQFYFYQVIVVAIVLSPTAFFLLRFPRRGLLCLLVISITFNPCFHVIRNTSYAFGMDLNFWTSDLIVIFIFFYLLISNALGMRERQNSHASMRQLGLPLLLWIAAGILSLVPAINNSIAIIELIRMLRIFLIFVAIFKLVEKPEDIRFLVVCIIIAFSVQTILILMEYTAGHPLLRLPGETREADIAGTIFRPSGSMGHSSNFAKLAALCLPICLAYIYALRKKVWRICVGLILVAGLVSLILTVSRAGLAASLFGLFWFLLLMLKNVQRKAVKIITPLFFLFVSIGLAWYVGGDRVISRVKWDYGSALSRPQMFSVAWNVIKDHPFIGVGLNNYTLIAPDYDRTPEKISINFPAPVHNIYMLHAAEIGIPGALCFIWFLIAIITMAFKRSSESRFLLDSAIAKAIGIGITCSWLQGLIDWGFRASIVHMSYLAVLAGAFAAFKYYNQNRSVGHVSGR